MKYFSIIFKGRTSDDLVPMLRQMQESEVDDAGATPLVAAVQSDRLDLVELMLGMGFNAGTKSFLTSPIGAAISSDGENSDKILHLLLERMPRLSCEHPMEYCGELNEPMLHAATRLEKLAAIKTLLSFGADPNWADSDGVNALTLASEIGNKSVLDVFKEALKQGQITKHGTNRADR